MSRRRRRKKGIIPAVFWGLLIGICVVVGVGFASGRLTEIVKSNVTEKVTKKVSEKVIEQTVQKALEQTGNPQAAEKAKEIVDNIDEEDKQKAEEIVERYANSDTLSDVMEIVGEGVDGESMSEVKDYLRENVSEQDQAELKELYEKYKDVIN